MQTASKSRKQLSTSIHRFANEGKVFELRLQIDSQQAVAGCFLLESLLSADSGVRNGDFLVRWGPSVGPDFWRKNNVTVIVLIYVIPYEKVWVARQIGSLSGMQEFPNILVS